MIIVAGLTVPIGYWPFHGMLLAILWAAHAFAETPLSYLGRRLAVFLPFLGLLAISLPFSQGFRSGGELAAAIAFRGLISFLAALWLTRVVSFDELIQTFRQFHVPELLLSVLVLSYRYLFVLWEELERMQTARAARTVNPRPLFARWRLSVQLIGMLLVRALTRAERVHDSMCARGWDGRHRTLNDIGPNKSFHNARADR